VPFLRFDRDRRGYESTFLLHAARAARAGQPRLLYWFRSPPHVKIGRAAFDEDAIRLLEQQHPEVEFDWDRILTARPPAAPEPRDPREGRPRGKPERRGSREGRRDASVPIPPRAAQPEAAPPAAVEPAAIEAILQVEESPIVHEVTPLPVPAAAVLQTAAVPEAAPARRFVRIFDQQAQPHHATEPAATERLLGAEQLTMLRARYAEIQARITARGGDPARVEALREQAERVNPDSWVTEADVQAGLASVDSALAELHRIVGRRRRRRRRRSKGPAPAGEQPQTAAVGEPSEDGDDEGEEDGPDDEGAL
jgi:hypothetical protein